MFEITFYFYIKHEIGFYDWVKKQDISKSNDALPEGVRFIELMKPVFGDVGKLQARLHINELNLLGKIHEASNKPGFLQELQSFMDNTRVVETVLVKKLL